MGDVEESLEQAESFDPDAAVRAVGLFDFSQKLVEFWEGSDPGVKREILDCVSLNRTVSDVTLCLAKRKPFDIIAEGLVLQDWSGRPDLNRRPRAPKAAARLGLSGVTGLWICSCAIIAGSHIGRF